MPNELSLAGLAGRRLQADEDLYSILAAQIVPTVVPTALIPDGDSTLTSLAETELNIVREGERIAVNGLSLQSRDILSSTGIIHVVGNLIPKTKPKPSPKTDPKKKYRNSTKPYSRQWVRDSGRYRYYAKQTNMGMSKGRKPGRMMKMRKSKKKKARGKKNIFRAKQTSRYGGW